MSDPIIEELLNHRSVLGLALLGGEDAYYIHKDVLVNTPTLLEDFETLTGWNTGVGTKELNTTEFESGNASIKLTTAVSTTGYLDKNVNWDLSVKNENFMISIYNHGAEADIDNILFYLATASNFSKYFSCYKQSFKPGWNHILIRNSDLIAYGGAVWSEPIVRLKISVVPVSGSAGITSFDKFNVGSEMKPFVLLTFDDGTTTQYTKAFAYMQQRRIVGTLYVIADDIGDAGYLTASQLITMHNAGWAIANHTNSHTDLTTLTQAQCESEFTTAQGILDGIGLSRASRHVAYPFGKTSPTVEAAMIASGMLTGRIVSGVAELIDYVCPYKHTYRIPARSMTNAIDLATAKGYIDTLVTYKRGANLLFHMLDDSAAGATTWKTSDFQELMDYIVSQRVQTLTIDELYRAQTSPISVKHK